MQVSLFAPLYFALPARQKLARKKLSSGRSPTRAAQKAFLRELHRKLRRRRVLAWFSARAGARVEFAKARLWPARKRVAQEQERAKEKEEEKEKEKERSEANANRAAVCLALFGARGQSSGQRKRK